MTGMELKRLNSQKAPIPSLTGELWVVFCEDLEENEPRYNSTALYFFH